MSYIPVKNIFSRTALKVLNACAKFAHKFSHGFGIKLTDSLGGKVVALDTQSEALQDWIKDQCHSTGADIHGEWDFGSAAKPKNVTSIESGYYDYNNGITEDNAWEPLPGNGWRRGQTAAEILILSRQANTGVHGGLFFRRAVIDRYGHIIALSKEEVVGTAITSIGLD